MVRVSNYHVSQIHVDDSFDDMKKSVYSISTTRSCFHIGSYVYRDFVLWHNI